MKKLILPLALLFLLFSCSSDDNKTPSVEELIIGTWAFSKNSTEIKTNDAEATKLIDAEFRSFDEEQKNEVYVFLKDGTYKKYDNINYPEQYDEGTYSILKGVLHLTDNGFLDFDYTLSIENDNTLKLASDWTKTLQEYPEFYGLEDYESLDDLVIEKVISIETYIKK